MFKLELIPVAEEIDGARFYTGTITLDDLHENFLAAAWLWDSERYKSQWLKAARSLVDGADKTAFVTSFIHPDADHNVVWPAWRIGPTVHIQNRLLLREHLPSVLDVDRIEHFIGDRRTVSDEGHVLSEWQVSLADIATYAGAA